VFFITRYILHFGTYSWGRPRVRMRKTKDKLLGFLAEATIGALVCIGLFYVFDTYLGRPGGSRQVLMDASTVVGVSLSYLLLKYVKTKGGWI
jgi:hypothetical protein